MQYQQYQQPGGPPGPRQAGPPPAPPGGNAGGPRPYQPRYSAAVAAVGAPAAAQQQPHQPQHQQPGAAAPAPAPVRMPGGQQQQQLLNMRFNPQASMFHPHQQAQAAVYTVHQQQHQPTTIMFGNHLRPGAPPMAQVATGAPAAPYFNQQTQQLIHPQMYQQQAMAAATYGGFNAAPQPHFGIPPPNMQQQQQPPQQHQQQPPQQQQQPQQQRRQPTQTPPLGAGGHHPSAASHIPPPASVSGAPVAVLGGAAATVTSSAGAGTMMHPGIPGMPPNSMMGMQMQSLMQAPQQHPPMAAAPAPAPSQPAPAAKPRKRNAITITDPNTGEVVDLLSGGKSKDEQKSASSTSDEARSKETKGKEEESRSSGASVAETFARQVAAAAATDNIHSDAGEKSSSPATSAVETAKEQQPEKVPAKAAPAAKPIHSEEKSEPAAAEAKPAATTKAAEETVKTEVPSKEAAAAAAPATEEKPVPAAAEESHSSVDEVSSESKKGKKKGSARKHELNRKGEKMGGSDMDAFADLKAGKDQQQEEGSATTAAKEEVVTAAAAPTAAEKPLQRKEEEVEKPASNSVAPSKTDSVTKSTDAKPEVAKKEDESKASSDSVDAVAPAAKAQAAPVSAVQESNKVAPAPAQEIPNHNAPATNDEKEVESAEAEDSSASEASPAAGPDPDAKQDPVDTKPKLKYAYKEDQWSPINMEGKKQYDRDFLLQLRKDPMSVERPPNLPNMEIVRDKPADRTKMSSFKITQPTDWMPSYVKATVSKGPGGPGKKGSQQGRKDGGAPGGGGPRKIVLPSLSIHEKVELKKAENAWKPTVKKSGTETNGDTENPLEDLIKKARAILNKLTPQKFEKLVDDFNELPIDNEDKLKACMKLVFEKAVDEPSFSVAYAKMCEVLQRKQVVADNGTPINFRKLLITQCQQEFEKDYMEGNREKFEVAIEAENDEEKKKTLKAEYEEEERRLRKRSLGNIKFIGELYKLKMLTVRIMHECVKRLIRSVDEESLECLCGLLKTVGKDLESETNSKLQPGGPQAAGISHLDVYFNEMKKIIDTKKTSSRVRFMLQDLIDLRRDNWKPRRDVAGPKTIDQIHKDAQREVQQQQLDNLMTKQTGGRPQDRDRMGPRGSEQGKRGSRGGAGGGPQGGRPGQAQGGEADGWATVPTKTPRQQERFDPSKLRTLGMGMMQRNQDADSMQLGPQGGRGGGPGMFASWGKGSAGSRSQTKEDSAVVAPNRFAAFSASMGASGGAGSGSEEPYESRRGMSSGPGGRSSRGPSSESERQKAVQAVKHINGPGGQPPPRGVLPPGGGRGSPASMSVPPPPFGPNQTQIAFPPPLLGTKPPPQINAAEKQRELLKGVANLKFDSASALTKPLLEEFIHNCDEKEALACVAEKFHPTTIAFFVEEAMNGVLERSKEARLQVGTLMRTLLVRHYLLPDQFESGLAGILKFAGDLLVDVPTLWDFVAQLLAPIFSSELVLPLTFLETSARRGELLTQEGGAQGDYAGKYAGAVLKAVSANMGHVKLGVLWREAGIRWESLLAPDRDVAKFLKEQELEFTVASSSNGPSSVDLSSPEILGGQLRKLLKANPKNNESIFDWIDSNIGERAKEPTFIRVLVDAVADSSISGVGNNQIEFQKNVLVLRTPIFKRYLDSKPDREAQALYALQHLMHRLEHPNKLLHQIFETLYDADVLSEDAFENWERCTNPAEQEGKGVAIKSTTQFFTWLREAEEEDEANVS